MFGLKIIKVQGHSMEPALRAGSFALVMKPSKFKIGDIVLFENDKIQMLKRISKIEKNLYYLIGDNDQASLDSRDFGWISKNKIYGKVIWH